MAILFRERWDLGGSNVSVGLFGFFTGSRCTVQGNGRCRPCVEMLSPIDLFGAMWHGIFQHVFLLALYQAAGD